MPTHTILRSPRNVRNDPPRITRRQLRNLRRPTNAHVTPRDLLYPSLRHTPAKIDTSR